jgi:B9 domain-containing protein 2
MNIWSHPIDVQYEFAGLQGWPKLSLEVWEHEAAGRSALAGYGFVVLPMYPGKHDLKITLWKPIGSMIESWTARYCGGAPHLRSQELVSTPTSRPQLTTETSGTASISLSVILGGMRALQVI